MNIINADPSKQYLKSIGDTSGDIGLQAGKTNGLMFNANGLKFPNGDTQVCGAPTPTKPDEVLLSDGVNWVLSPIAPINKGFILMWTGTTAPAGWALCDGSNGTPDLRNKFLVGASSTAPIGSAGGAQNVTLTTAHMPSHTHSNTLAINPTFNFNTTNNGNHTHGYNSFVGAGGIHGVYGGGVPRGTNAQSSAAGAHNHTYSGSLTNPTVSVPAEGGGQAFSILPPFYALAFIMKL